METTPSNRSKREWKRLEVVGGNGLLDRRAFLRGGAAFAAAMTGYTFVQSAAAEPLADDSWSREPGTLVPAYGVPSRFEKNVARTLSNPKGEPRTQHARTPHHLINGTITPNGLHFVISHAGDADIDPDKHRLIIHGLVKRPLMFTLDTLARYPTVSRMTFVECGGNSAPFFSKEPIQASVQALHGLVSCAEWTGVRLSTLLEETGIDSKAKWLIAEGADAPALSRSVPLTKALDDAMIALYQNGERIMPGNGYPMRLLLPGWEGNTPPQARRPAGHDLLRGQDLRADSARRKGVSVLFPAGGQIVYHPSLTGADVERARLLRDFRHRLFRQRPDFEGHGVSRRWSELGASGAAGTGAQQGPHSLSRTVALGGWSRCIAKPRVGRGRQRAADARSSRGPARPDDEGPARNGFSGPAL